MSLVLDLSRVALIPLIRKKVKGYFTLDSNWNKSEHGKYLLVGMTED